MKHSLFAAVIGLILSFGPAFAGSATWSQNAANGDWNEPANWVPATVPNGSTDMATFGASNLTSLSISNLNDEQVSGITFNIGASPFTITAIEEAGSQGFALMISGMGIINNSGIIQHFVSKSAYNGAGAFLFANSSTAGNLTVYTNNGSPFAVIFEPFPGGEAFLIRPLPAAQCLSIIPGQLVGQYQGSFTSTTTRQLIGR